MQAIFYGTVLAESDDIVRVDGNPYFPREAMNTQFFRESSHSTVRLEGHGPLLGCGGGRSGHHQCGVGL